MAIGRLLLTIGLAVSILGAMVSGQTGLPPSRATLGAIHHMTVEPLPEPRERIDIGIGEEVACWIDPPSNLLGTVTWSASGDGSVYPIIGNRCTLTGSLINSDGLVTVQASASGSGTTVVEAPRVAFNVLAPRGVKPTLHK
jgi:hypothetical protein